ncbi:epimerase family protein SDR39U1 [Amia ocellicauda]|uniref:epimerase family protein SDR39U1 n=1 Tax=Amia ocellicauda TaxID=2972642 RepID=UPI0034640275
MRVVIGGGTGFVGRALTQLLRSKGHEVTVISRQPGPGRITWDDLKSKGLPPCDGAVNLAGEPVLNPLRWWNESYKRDLVSSRVETTCALAQAIATATQPPHAWVLVTGVACYKPSETERYTEGSAVGQFDLLSRLVKQWEEAGVLPETVAPGTRQVIVRAGAVLGRDGGAVQMMLWPFWLGLGGPLGSGRQPFPWIHVSDLAGIIAHALQQDNRGPRQGEGEKGEEEEVVGVQGILNGVAPADDTNADFVRALGGAMGRPTLLSMPGFALNATLGRERAVILLEGQRVVPERTLASGYVYRYPDLHSALNEIVGS